MYGELGAKLVQHAKRTQSLAHLPPYQTELVRDVVREVRTLEASVNSRLAPFSGSFNPTDEPTTATALLVESVCMRRNKRCLLAYHRVRAERIQEKIWAGGELGGEGGSEGRGRGRGSLGGDSGGGGSGDGDGLEGAGSGSSSLSPEEEEYARAYTDLLAAYKGRWTDVDLTGSLEPPRDLFVDVRVLKDAGEIQTEYGSINLTKNSQFYVRQSDVEKLIAQGYLQKLS